MLEFMLGKNSNKFEIIGESLLVAEAIPRIKPKKTQKHKRIQIYKFAFQRMGWPHDSSVFTLSVGRKLLRKLRFVERC
jgi:hypothetical protein